MARGEDSRINLATVSILFIKPYKRVQFQLNGSYSMLNAIPKSIFLDILIKVCGVCFRNYILELTLSKLKIRSGKRYLLTRTSKTINFKT